MITLLIEADAEAGEGLARTLSALVPAVVEGVLLDAIVINADQNGDIEKIADIAGAVCIAGGNLAAAFDMARGDWLMCLEPGARPHGEWTDAVVAAFDSRRTVSGSPLRFRVEGPRRGLADLFRRPRALRAGLIIHKGQAAAAGVESLEALARGRSARRLAAAIMPAEH